MLARLMQKATLMIFLSGLLLVSIVIIIAFDIVAVDEKYHQEVRKLQQSKELLIANKDQKNDEQMANFKKLNHTSPIWTLLDSGEGINVYITYLNKHIVAINSLSMAQKLLSEKNLKNDSSVQLVAKVISQQLEVIRQHALAHSSLLTSYEERYLKESIFLLKNLSTSTVSQSQRHAILHRSYMSLIGQAQAITDKMLLVLSEEKKSAYYFLYGFMFFFLLILLVQIKTIASFKRGAADLTKRVSFIRDYLRKNNGDYQNATDGEWPLEYLFTEAKISVGVLANKNRSMKNLYKAIKNSNSLAHYLGYEINALTSIVSGGLLLNKKEGDAESSFDQEIYGALTALENLSGSFNHLFEIKPQIMDFSHEFNIRAELHKMFVLLNATCRGLNKKFDFVIEDSVPKFACGDAYRFYWCLYNILVRCIEVGKHPYCLVHISESDGTSLENKRLQINLLSTSGEYLSLSSFLESMNNVGDDDELFDNNTHLYESIINSFFEGSVSIKETDLGDSIISLSLFIIPKKYEEKERQESAKVLIYANEGLQTSIVLKKFEQAGADAVYCKSEDELLKQVSKDAAFDFIFISDALLENKMLITILERKLEGKILLLSDLSNIPAVTVELTAKVIYLPLYLSNLITVLSSKEEAEEQEAQERHVLVVDDDPSQQVILAHFLKRSGIVPAFANDCDSALALIKENAFDMVFMDCIMPDKDGFEGTLLIREYEETLKLAGKLEKVITIIGNTSLTGEGEIDKCIQCGMDAVLNKPYKNDKILEILERYK